MGFIKRIILSFLYPILSSRRLFNFCIRNKFFTFVFHDTSHNPCSFSKDCDLNTPPTEFEKQIGWIKKHFRFINPDELKNLIETKEKLSSPHAMITFDDGYKSLFDYTFPFLESQNIPAVLFINGEIFAGDPITSGKLHYLSFHHEEFKKFCHEDLKVTPEEAFLHITPKKLEEFFKKTPSSKELETRINQYCGENLSASDLKKFENSAYIYYGSHTWSHYNLSILTKEEFIGNLNRNTEFLKQFRNYRKCFSATFGIYNSRYGKWASDLGYKIIFGFNNGANTSPLSHELKRLSLPNSIKDEKQFFFEINKRVLKRCLNR
jgi:peptidoglycan/xylan/chitin deacetylase (PgdA/CDA1 family)